VQAAIAVLPPEVIDQIAAGEVIERPASVVKELIDNAIDAGARSIAVETHAGGRELIKVVDDGVGMTPNDAVLALERHATSKLRVFDDLWGLTTMGFRGEALPAIASVSRLTLTTRRAEAVAATRVVIDSGRLESVDEVGAPVGTTVEVVGLLRSVPARLKFLKSDPTEASHTTDLVAKIAMAYPALHLRLRHNGRNTLDVPPDRDVFARAQALLGRRTGTRLVTSLGEDAGVRVTCVLGAPELAQTTARGVKLFVRRRPVRDRGLLHAVCVGYGELVPRGRYPLAVLLVDPPATAVDVNVHPQKAEVRFADPGAVCAAVRHVVQAAVARAQWEVAPSRLPVVLSGTPPPPLPFDAPASVAATRFAAELREGRNRWNHDRPQADLGLESPGPAPLRGLPRVAGMRSTPAEGVRRWNDNPGSAPLRGLPRVAGMRSTPAEGVRR
jgi:DNA mismatch repair protein MutL